ncbi:MFS transporter [Candidatus Paracaedibacter symbiosus]|uniref:MFS transporter n=1 Tax=Candidatus Paracaedibacter symbiosus TaxID=244582 RepID=UPI0005098809
MSILSELRQLTSQEKHVIIASYLGWTLDAFDFFILVFVLKDIAQTFGTDIKSVTLAITLTLAMRPIGALLFGIFADRLGRRPILMANILIYSVLEFASGFAPSLTVLIILRALYGIAMGGEWGVGASLTLESVPEKVRGIVSGILQTGYPSGYLLASIVFFFLYPLIGWRGMFMVGVIPALLVFYIRRNVEESPAFISQQHHAKPIKFQPLFKGHQDKREAKNAKPETGFFRYFSSTLKGHVKIFMWAVVMMTGFNFLSHGTQDIYPTFLEQQRNLSSHTIGIIAIVYNIGAILGGLFFGALSSKIGRRRAIVTAVLLVLPAIPMWTQATTPIGLAIGSFLVQFFVQGAWGVVPVHLNEISPDKLRGTFPGFAYQVGNLFASYNATMQAGIAATHGGDYALALALVAGIVAILLALVAGFGYEAKDRRFGEDDKVI